MRLVPLIAAALWLAPPAASQTTGYAGQQTRAIKALSAQETADAHLVDPQGDWIRNYVVQIIYFTELRKRIARTRCTNEERLE